MTTKHTPGPWHLEGGETLKVHSESETVCEIWGSGTMGFEQFEANANLIAASPQLLEALIEAYLENGCKCHYPGCWHEKARGAFERAKVQP